MESESVNKRRGSVQIFMRSSFFHWGKQNIQAWSNWHKKVKVSANLPISVSLFFFFTGSSLYPLITLTEVNFMQQQTNHLQRHINRTRSSSYSIRNTVYVTLNGGIKGWSFFVCFNKSRIRNAKKKKSISRKIKMYFAAINQMLKGSFRW